MRNFQQKGRFSNIIHSKPVLVLLSIVVVFFAWGVMGFWNKMEDTSRNRDIAQNKVTELEQKKAQLSSDLAKLNTDQGREETIRDKFGLAKEGEGEIVVVEDKNPPVPEKAESGGFWGFIKNLFK